MAYADRDIEVKQLQRFLQAESCAWICLCHGIADASRTTLLLRLQTGLPAGWLPMRLDFQEKAHREDYEALLRVLAEALLAGGISSEAWAAYQRRADQVEELKHVHVKMDMRAQDHSDICGSVQEVRLGGEESQRIVEAMREMAYAWLNLADQVEAWPIAFLDHWEVLLDQASQTFAAWLFEDLLSRLHRRRPEFRLVIASDRPLRRDWLLRQRVRSEEVLEWEMKS